jgi:hypothetical protein
MGIINGSHESQRGDWANARHRHQPLAHFAFPGQTQHHAMQLGQFAGESSAGLQHSADHLLKHRVPRDQFAEPGIKPGPSDLTDLQAERPQDSAHPDVEIDTLACEKLAGSQQRPDFLRVGGFSVNRFEPAEPQHLSDPPCVIAVSLHSHGRDRRLDMSRFEQDHVEPLGFQTVVQPARKRPGFQPDPRLRASFSPQDT